MTTATTAEKEAVATRCPLADFADGRGDGERLHIERRYVKVVDSLEGVRTPALYQKVLPKQVTPSEAAALRTPTAPSPSWWSA